MLWLLHTILIHIIFLGSIFVIYFRSPVLTNINPQTDLKNPPAKRLVLIVTDGLRADSFLKNDCNGIPNIKNIFSKEGGILGISHTRVPTESRPGHIAIIAGLYEDPSAVTKGWKENPIDFDSVFNRSKKTYAFGSHEILTIFSKKNENEKIKLFSYDHELDFSGKDKTYMLDTWVFEKVKEFLSTNSVEIKEDSKIIFFLHLLGLDSAGHIHKPETNLFNENLNITDYGIFQTYQLFEEIFNDKQTAYILTSDHGMTNSGSHGDGDPHETETPLVAWGAGINNWNSKNFYIHKKQNFFHFENLKIPRFDINQADIAPLMSTLIGVSVPVNNYGTLPGEFLNVSMDYHAKAMYNNALQILSQYEKLLQEFENGYFSNILPEFDNLRRSKISYFKNEISNQIMNLKSSSTIDLSKELITIALEGIDYYQMYYEKLLLLCTTLSFFGWITYLIILFLNNSIHTKDKNSSSVFIFVMISTLLASIFIYLQKIPFTIGLYIICPIFCWIPALNKFSLTSVLHIHYYKYLKHLIILFIGAELLVFSFKFREIISFLLIIFVLYEAYLLLEDKNNKKFKYSSHYKWIISAVLLCIFPILPNARGSRSDLLLSLGAIIWVLKSFLFKMKIDRFAKYFSSIGLINLIICLYCHNNFIGIPLINLILSWILTGLSFVLPLLSNSSIKIRIRTIFYYLTFPLILLSVSYEPLFFLFLEEHLLSFLDLKTINLNTFITIKDNDVKVNIWEYFRTSFAILLYTFLSFFGTGNIASISSFDPNVVRCFVTTFSPFVITGLIILKLIIPIITITSMLCGLSIQLKINEKKLFISLLLICEILCLNFLFMVTNKGSWLEIGSSISRFVIMEATTLMLVLITNISKFLIIFNLAKKLN